MLSQKDVQLEALQKEHLELMRQLTGTQESLQTKERSLDQLEARYLELEAQLAELQEDATAKEDAIQFLQNEKIVLEVALQAARADKGELDEGAQRLGEGVLEAADMLDQLRQEVQVKASQVRAAAGPYICRGRGGGVTDVTVSPLMLKVESMQKENSVLKKQAQKLKEQYTQQKVRGPRHTIPRSSVGAALRRHSPRTLQVMVEAYRRDATSKDQLISELKASKKRLLAEVKELKQEVLSAQGEKAAAELELQRLKAEASRVQEQMSSLEGHLQAIQGERDQLEAQIQVGRVAQAEPGDSVP